MSPRRQAAPPDPLPAQTEPGTPAWRRARAREIIRDHTLLAAAANLVPVPIADSLAVAAVQLRMLDRLSRLYGRDYNADLGHNLTAAFTMGFVHHVFTRHGAAAGWKLTFASVPLVGRALAVAVWPAVFAAFTHILGHACARHFEAGGHLADFRAEQLARTPFAPLALHLAGQPGATSYTPGRS